MKKLLILLLALLLTLACVACGPKGNEGASEGGGPTNESQGDGYLQEGGDNAGDDLYWDVWTNASGKTFYSHLANDSSTTLTVKVIKNSVSFTFTVKTTAAELRPALLGSGFAAAADLNEEGTAFIRVNGVRAQSGFTWILTKEGETAIVSPYSEIADGETYVFTYTKIAQ